MRIAILTWRELAHPQAGGSEVVVDRLARGLQSRGHDVTVICGGPVGEQPYTTVDSGGTYDQYLRAPRRFRSLPEPPDVVIDVENGLPFFSPLWSGLPRVLLVHHVHTDQWAMHFPEPAATAGRLIEARLMPRLYGDDPVVAVSRSTALGLAELGFAPGQITVAEPGVDLDDATEPKSEEPLFVAVGRLVAHKRIDLMLSAWSKVRPRTGGRLVIIGDGPELERLQTIVPEGASLLGRVPRDEMASLLRRAWLFVHTAHHEGWGVVIMEAAAAGTPTLALDVRGVRDAVVDGSTGVLAPDLDALCERWVELAGDPERRAALGAAARERAKELSWDRMTERVETVLADAMATARRRSPWRQAGRSARTPGRTTPLGQAMMSDVPDTTSPPSTRSPADGLARSLRLFRGFRTQFADPEGFYTLLSDDTVDLVRRYATVPGSRVVDMGGGPGYFAEAFARAGARSCFIEIDPAEMGQRGRATGRGIVGDACRAPFADGTFDVSHSSNVIEHVTDPRAMFDEMVRIVRPGGTIFLAFTNWWSPFGGHETAPWHFLGGERAAQRYEQRTGQPPKNRYGTSLFQLHIGEVLRWARTHPSARLIDAFPRYYPGWSRPLVSVPGIREVATWNLALVLRRH